MLAILAGIAIIYFSIPASPEEKVEAARKALSQARMNKSDIYASTEFKRSERAYDSALSIWKRENGHFILFREYNSVKEWSEESILYAKKAERLSRVRLELVEARLAVAIDSLKKQWNKTALLLDKFSPSEKAISDFRDAYSHIDVSTSHHAQGNFILAQESMQKGKEMLMLARMETRVHLEQYFLNHPGWTEQINNAIKRSAQDQSVLILVDKMEHQCLLYQSGKLTHSFKIEMGPNWTSGDKQQQGDKATPEGMYMVKEKKRSRQTRYHKALLINYPNQDDLDRFEQFKKQGRLAPDAKIGGLLEIHGMGGKGFNWTEGCIALKNPDMDILYSKVKKGTPIVIVGGIKSLEYYKSFLK